MSTLNSHITISPIGKEEECAQFIITHLPEQFTMFDVMSGWSAHRLEELYNNGKIIRPAYVSTNGRNEYVKLEDRK